MVRQRVIRPPDARRSGNAGPIAERVPQICPWTHNTHDSTWDTGCGEKWMLNDGTPTEHGVRFCHSCGKPVAAAEMGQDAA
jgi:ribosome modulation factor